MQQPGGEQTEALWNQLEGKVSSILLEAECLITLRRMSLRVQGTEPDKWLASRTSALSQLLLEIHLKHIDASIMEIIRHENLLSECRTLDALHLATALYFRDRSGEAFGLLSLDERMRQIARKFALPVWPA